MFNKKKNEQDFNGEVIGQNSLPVNPGDPALVVDLPDGQKLILGQIEPGTIIEVATWRGTGRPDSRTTRLLLGTSSKTNNEVKAIKPQKNKEVEKDYSVFAPRKSHAEIANEITGEIPVVKERIVTKGKHGVAPKNTVKSKIYKTSLVAATLVVVLTGIANNNVFEFKSVDSGISTALGGADSILAVTTKVNDLKKGDVIIANLKIENNSETLLAQVAATGTDRVLVQANGIQYEIPSETVEGKVRAVIPFLGKLVNILNA